MSEMQGNVNDISSADVMLVIGIYHWCLKSCAKIVKTIAEQSYGYRYDPNVDQLKSYRQGNTVNVETWLQKWEPLDVWHDC